MLLALGGLRPPVQSLSKGWNLEEVGMMLMMMMTLMMMLMVVVVAVVVVQVTESTTSRATGRPQLLPHFPFLCHGHLGNPISL